tara:strand:- start:186 stop:389 length:204 start_codon:yes stop_codon:yes gene_type:complete
MKVLEQLQVLKSSIDKLKKLNEDLLELNSAKKIKITSLENRIIKLKEGIKQTSKDIEKFIENRNGNT